MKLCRICLESKRETRIVSKKLKVFFTDILRVSNVPKIVILCTWCSKMVEKCLILHQNALQAHNILTNLHKVTNDYEQMIKKEIALLKPLYRLSYSEKVETINIIENHNNISYISNENCDQESQESNCIHNKIGIEKIFIRDIDDSITNDNYRINTKEVNVDLYTDRYEDETTEESTNINAECNVDVGQFTKRNKCTKKKRHKTELKSLGAQFKVFYLSLEEQVKEIADKKSTESYLRSSHRCEFCGSSFLTEYAHSKHMSKHSDLSGKHKCEICKLHFSNPDVLTQHLLAHRRIFECEVCNTKLRRPWHCAVHRKKCGSDGSVVCVRCRKIFSDDYSLNIHEKSVHLNEKKHICEYCKRCFSNKQILTVHLRTHSGERPYKCEECNRRFTSSSNLKSHKAIHATAGERFYCVECNSYFKTAKSLKRHFTESAKHVSVDDTRYKCADCNKSFIGEKGLKSHINIVHLKLSTYKCNVCDKIISNNSNLKKHLRNVHGVVNK